VKEISLTENNTVMEKCLTFKQRKNMKANTKKVYSMAKELIQTLNLKNTKAGFKII